MFAKATGAVGEEVGGLRSLGRLARMPADNVRFPKRKKKKRSLFTEKQRGGKNTTGQGVQGRAAAGWGA